MEGKGDPGKRRPAVQFLSGTVQTTLKEEKENKVSRGS